MRIIIVNYRYFISSGPERYMFNIKELMERHGHSVIPFSIQSSYNISSEYGPYFLSAVGSGKEVYFSDYKLSSVRTVVQGLSRMVYSFEAKQKLEELIDRVQPDLIYVLHYQNKISMSIFDAAVKKKVPVVHRISDFGQICVNQHFYRSDTKSICEKCLHGSKWSAVVHKCVYDSYVYSFIKVIALKVQELLQVSKKIDAFVIPSQFTLSKLKDYGLPAGKLHHIPTFFNFSTINKELSVTYEPFALYIGRIEEEKGLLSLVKAFENTPYKLKIIGFSKSGYETQLKDYLKDKQHHIEFLGKKDFAQIQQYLSRCAFTVVPSEIYDNLPNTVLESFAFGKAVVATRLGSLKELIIEEQTGLLFEHKNLQDFRGVLDRLFRDPSLCRQLGEGAYQKLHTEFCEKQHYHKLLNLFQKVVER